MTDGSAEAHQPCKAGASADATPHRLGRVERAAYFPFMLTCSSRPDVVVIGAGAAGIAAARSLLRGGLDVAVIEARDRLGGRAHTVEATDGLRLDLGCEWLHSADRNSLAALAGDLGFALDRSAPPWRRRHIQRGFDDADHDAFEREQRAFYRRLEAAALEARRSGRDQKASELLDPGARWNGFADAISTYYNGAPWDRVSILDFDNYVDTETDWRVERGYGTLIAAAGADLPVALGCAATRIDASGRVLRVETTAGLIEARAAIVTVPTAVLSAGSIRFDPALDGHLEAAAGLPLGLANKLFFALDGAEDIEPGTRLIGDPTSRDTGTYTLRPRGLPLVEGYFGGDYARSLETGGPEVFAETARREIAAALGRPLASALRLLAATAWAADPCSRGSYSHALPGRSADRNTLAEPFQERILFAGEATSPNFFSTAHGAWDEGLRAAAYLAERIPPAADPPVSAAFR